MTTDPTTGTAPVRIPIGRNITYAVRGMPLVPNAYGPGFLDPREVSLTYRAAADSQLGRFHAYVKGEWVRDGETVPSGEKLPGQHYYGDPSAWPDWLAEEARLHDPEPVPAPTDLRDRVAEALADADGWKWAPDAKAGSPTWQGYLDRADAVLAVLPAPVDRATAEERDRYRTAWRSARERAQAFGEGILLHVAQRDFWQKAAEQNYKLYAAAAEQLRRLAAGTADTEPLAVRRARHEGAIEALRSAAQHVCVGIAVGPIPLEVRPAVEAWLYRLANDRRERAVEDAASGAGQDGAES